MEDLSLHILDVAEKLRQCWRNIHSNQHCREYVQDLLILTIEDNGRGMPAEFVPKGLRSILHEPAQTRKGAWPLPSCSSARGNRRRHPYSVFPGQRHGRHRRFQAQPYRYETARQHCRHNNYPDSRQPGDRLFSSGMIRTIGTTVSITREIRGSGWRRSR